MTVVDESTRRFDPVELEILWQSLIATVNEQARALQRAAFSPIVREAGDLANAVFDRRGRMVAQAVTGTPGHINSLAIGAANMLAEFPIDGLEPGDVLITNDPYKTAGQLLDVTVLVPAWRNGTIIAFFGSTIHHTDVGGYGIGAGGRDCFEEGLWIPICKLMKRGERNDDVWRFILSNVRQPDHMAGDLHAQLASGEVGAQRLATLCQTHGLDDIEALADEIVERSEAATRASIRELPAGSYESSAVLDLADGSIIDIVCTVTVDPDAGEITVDYDGTSPASPWGINVVKNYTHAYTTFTVRSVLNPDIPNNHGSLAPIKVEAPEGTIVNAVLPQPGTARHVVGMFLPNALLKALAQIRPDDAMAEGSGAVWTMQVNGNHDDGSPFITAMFTYAGGVGARATKSGLSACTPPAEPETPTTPAPKKPPIIKADPEIKPDPAKPKVAPIKEIDLTGLFTLRSEGKALVYDVRLPLYYKLGHIEGAILFYPKPFDEAFEKEEPQIKQALRDGKEIVLYCGGADCKDSHIVAKMFAERGIPVSVYSGGWAEWKEFEME